MNYINYGDEIRKQKEDPRWAELRWKVHELDNYTCHRCGEYWKNGTDPRNYAEHSLAAHHTYYKNDDKGKPSAWYVSRWDYSPEELVSLCKKCHDEIHNVTGWNPDRIYERTIQEKFFILSKLVCLKYQKIINDYFDYIMNKQNPIPFTKVELFQKAIKLCNRLSNVKTKDYKKYIDIIVKNMKYVQGSIYIIQEEMKLNPNDFIKYKVEDIDDFYYTLTGKERKITFQT